MDVQRRLMTCWWHSWASPRDLRQPRSRLGLHPPSGKVGYKYFKIFKCTKWNKYVSQNVNYRRLPVCVGSTTSAIKDRSILNTGFQAILEHLVLFSAWESSPCTPLTAKKKRILYGHQRPQDLQRSTHAINERLANIQKLSSNCLVFWPQFADTFWEADSIGSTDNFLPTKAFFFI